VLASVIGVRLVRYIAILFFFMISSGSIACDSGILIAKRTASGGLLQATACSDYQVEWLGQQIDVKKGEDFALGVGRDIQGQQTLTYKGLDQGQLIVEVEPREYRIQRVDGVPQKTVTPNAKQQARARADAETVYLARAKQVTAMQHWQQPVIRPAKGVVTGVYGSQRVYNGKPGRPHYGLDIAGPKGAEVIAPLGGEVVLAADLFYSGKTIIVNHGSDLTSSFLHLSDIVVNVGERIEAGQLLGRIGATGRATGPHLDWRMNWRNQRVDPQLLLEEGFPNTATKILSK